MKWIYRLIVATVALIVFGVVYYCNVKGICRGSPEMNPYSPLMAAGMYALGMRMVTESIDRLRWKILLAGISLLLTLLFLLY